MSPAGITHVAFAPTSHLGPKLAPLLICEVVSASLEDGTAQIPVIIMLAESVFNRSKGNPAENAAPVVEDEPRRCDERDSMNDAGSTESIDCAFDIPARCGTPFSL